MKRYYADPTVAFASDLDYLQTELVLPSQILGQADTLAGEVEQTVEFYIRSADTGPHGGPSVVLNASTARQLAAELLNRADAVDEFVAQRSVR